MSRKGSIFLNTPLLETPNANHFTPLHYANITCCVYPSLKKVGSAALQKGA